MHEIKNPIDPSTLAKLITTQSHDYILIDCRFDYEFQAGHIKGAKNIVTPEKLEEEFLSDPTRVRQLMTRQTAIILHCEYSERRAPQAWQQLRDIDRQMNHGRWPKLYLPQLYLLQGGISAFWKLYPDLCEGSYKS